MYTDGANLYLNLIPLIIISVALEEVRNKLAKENTQLNYEREKIQLAEYQAKREQSSIAFQQDVARYLAGGSLQTSELLFYIVLKFILVCIFYFKI